MCTSSRFKLKHATFLKQKHCGTKFYPWCPPMAGTQGCYQEAEVQLNYAYERENPISLFHCGFPNEFGILYPLLQRQVSLQLLGLPKFGPEPRFGLRTSELNCRFGHTRFCFLHSTSRFGLGFFTWCSNENWVQTCLNHEPFPMYYMYYY